MIKLSPENRISADELLCHAYFHDIKNSLKTPKP
jgi:hypothetical protein